MARTSHGGAYDPRSSPDVNGWRSGRGVMPGWELRNLGGSHRRRGARLGRHVQNFGQGAQLAQLAPRTADKARMRIRHLLASWLHYHGTRGFMSLAFVPHDHVVHLLGTALKRLRAREDTRDRMLAKLNSKDAGDQTEVRDYIERAHPGAIQRLDDIWAFRGQRAVLLWRLPYLDGQSIEGALTRHSARLHANSARTWVKMRSKATPENASVRKLRVDVDEDDLQAEVWITKHKRITHEEETKEHPSTEPVLVRINFAGGDVPLGEAYASYQDARYALFALLDWLRGVVTPRAKSAEQEEVILPVGFTERKIEALAVRLGWGIPTELRGPDATGECGEITFAGHKEGFVLGALDSAVPKVQAQLAATNATRRYKFPFQHADGYVEQPQASFHFLRAQSSVQFHTKTSRLAIDHVIAEVRAELKV